MALIKCPECGKEISTYAVQCIHCGYPIAEMKQQNTIDKEVHQKISDERCPLCRVTKPHIIVDNIKEVCSVCGYVFNQEYVNSHKHLLPPSKKPACPKCGSTSITTGARGVDGFWGFLGASRTVNRCANCGHSWEPRG